MINYGKDLEIKRKLEPCNEMFPKNFRFNPRVLCRSRVVGSKVNAEIKFFEENLQEVVLENSKLIKQAEIHIEEISETVKSLQQKLTLAINELNSKSIASNDTSPVIITPTPNLTQEITEVKVENSKIKECIKIEKLKLKNSQQRFEVLQPYHQQILLQIQQISSALLKKFESFPNPSLLPSKSQEKYLKTLKKLKNFT